MSIYFYFFESVFTLDIMNDYRIQTKRFVLRKMTEGGQDDYYLMSCNEEVMKYVTGYALSREESDKMYQEYLEENANDSILGRYFIRDRVTGELVGIAKLDLVGEDVEIGYRIRKEHWGRGVATEVAKWLLYIGHSRLNADRVIAFVNVDNAASIRVLEKIGMQNIERIEDLDEIKYKFIHLNQTQFYMKKVLYAILGLVAIFLLAALVMPKDYAVEKEIVIHKPKSEVFAYLKSLKNQDNWSVWMKLDPKIKKEYTGVDGTVGFVSKWEGNEDVGQGEQEIKKIIEGDRIDTQLRFIKPFKSTSDAYMITETVDSTQTKVKWGFDGSMPFPMNAFMPFMGIEKAIGNDFTTGLQNLKGILEK